MNTRLGIALTGFAAVFALLALTPAGASFVPNEGGGPAGYAMAEVVHRDVGGELVSSHTVHNRLVDGGESAIIRGTFVAPLAADDKPTLLCISDRLHSSIVGDIESALTARFSPFSTFAPALNTCIMADIDTNTSGVAIMNATFAGGTNLLTGQTINSVLVCDTSHPSTTLQTCATAGSIFASVEIPPETIMTGDTVDIAYVFDLTSDTY
ncbi:hypothetical protein CENSYa_1518 [Cenarchaeum symbiosum A]|uniref:Uncharacterized protein n=1 Tax=Cenarchaeum symbiosum (strain A) TaxID=414004 RepID=A0RXS3_CENSY|nr:hypothetical protein CENSYa_1518 [Cenarchaeum symbiosum A]